MAYAPPTIAALKATIKQRLDMANSVYIDDTSGGEMDDMIRGSQLELWELLGSLNALPVITTTRTTTAGVNSVTVFDVATDGYNALRVLRIDLTLPGGDRVPLRQVNMASDTFSSASESWRGGELPRYSLYRSETDIERIWGVRFFPTPDAAYTLTFYGYAEPAYDETPAANTPEIYTAGYDEYVILDVIIKVRVKQEADASQPIMQKEALRQRIVRECTPFDYASAHTIVDRRQHDDTYGDPGGFWRR